MLKEPNSPRVPPDRPLALTALACSKLILYCVTITATHTDLSDFAIASRIGVYIALIWVVPNCFSYRIFANQWAIANQIVSSYFIPANRFDGLKKIVRCMYNTIVSECDRVSIGNLTGVGTNSDKYATITFCWAVRASHSCRIFRI